MTLSELRYLTLDERLSVKLKADGTDFEITPKLEFIFNEESGEYGFKVSGFILSCKDGEIEEEDFEKLARRFTGVGLELISINDEYQSIEEYEEKKAFGNISMEDLLKINLPVADSFSLTCPYNDGFDRERPFGIYNISDELASSALSGVEKWAYETAKEQYENISLEEKAKLPPFEELYNNIVNECSVYRKENADKAEKCGGNVFFADCFLQGKTKYKEPCELWHIYHAVDFVGTCRFGLDKMRNNALKRELDCELNEKEFIEIKSSLIKTEVSFSWHCTTSGTLSKTFYFELNDTTVNWLKNRQNDYDFKLLEDLAFYSGGQLIFSSCTHEKFHTQIKR